MTRIVTRFAPSPTGFLHIGGVRTALFNWLFARHHQGEFRLRIEDTDRSRSTSEAIEAITEGLSWLQLDHDGPTVFQSKQINRHKQVAAQLLESNNAYPCFLTPEQLDEERQKARSENRRFQSKWRDADPSTRPDDQPFALRLKAPVSGHTIIDDEVQGSIRFSNAELDDLVLLRADGTPTYMLAVVVDDHDMGVSHIIRGDDHLVNAARQSLIYKALGWPVPVFAHIPLIHGPDGKKLSKRHGALGVDAYRDMGYLPEALLNYLLRLGWSHGDQEFFTVKQAIEKFSLSGINKGPSQLDFDKMQYVNGHFLQTVELDRLSDLFFAFAKQENGVSFNAEEKTRLRAALPHLVTRAKLLPDLVKQTAFLVEPRPIYLNNKAKKAVKPERLLLLKELYNRMQAIKNWDEASLNDLLQSFAADNQIGFGQFGPILRVAISGSNPAPDLALACELLGRKETLERIDDLLHLQVH